MSYPSKAGGLSACQSCTGRASPNGGWVGRASTGRYATVTTPCRKPNGERRPFNLSWEKSVTNKNLKSGRVLPRPLTLAAATAVALSTAFAASAAERIDTSALQAGGSYDRFIVKYRDGSAEYSNSARDRKSTRLNSSH